MPPLAAALFDYRLPPELIAQAPTTRRDESRLLVVDRTAHTLAHHHFSDLPRFLGTGDILFRNNAAVFPARLRGRRETGGEVECFLLAPSAEAQTWRCLVKPGRRLRVGATFAHPAGEFSAEIVRRETDGSAFVRFTTPGNGSLMEMIRRVGEVPLPPYISRDVTDPANATRRAQDLERYQTVYADGTRPVAVAAPTAGLHFTPELISTLGNAGVQFADLTLHVGLGTFKPIVTDTIEAHQIHREVYEISPATQRALFSARTGRRVAVGTTTVRTIEDFLARHDATVASASDYVAEATTFIYPPRTFRGVDALITNFHQPRSTLLCLVAAFLAPGSIDGIAWLHEIYAEAIAHRYRFFSYGDAMLIL